MIAALATLAALSPVQDEEALRVHAKLHQRIAPAIVGVRGGGRRGTGILVGRPGLIVTSLTAVGARDESVEVFLKGHKRVRGSVLKRNPELELAIVKIDPKEVPGTVELGDSDQVKLGQICYVLGDSYNSIFTDDQVALTLGHISGRYEVDKPKGRSTYKGEVLETNAGVNPNNDGGALVDAAGRLVGMITMNYHEARFTGVAIPINRLRGEIEAALREHREPGWIGLVLEEKGGKIVVARVSPDSPASKGGLRVGDTFVSFAGKAAGAAGQANALVKECWVGEAVLVEVLRDGKRLKATLVPEAADFY
jgi:S1-C subfamily serine protease